MRFGKETSVSAAWTIPRLETSRSNVTAASWIGAQSSDGAFIQVGTMETRGTDPDNEGDLPYEVFWSDTQRHFQPQILATIHPGDRFTAKMTLVGGRWRIEIRDLTDLRVRGDHPIIGFSTSEEAKASFTLTEWLDERQAPTSGWAYPALSEVKFTQLQVNGRSPAPSQLEASWMSIPSINLGPSPLTDDSFTIQPQKRLGGLAARYESIVGPLNSAASALQLEQIDWDSQTSASRVASEIRPLLAAMRTADAALGSYRWPAPIRSKVLELRAEEANRITAALRDLERSSSMNRDRAFGRFLAAAFATHSVSVQIHRYLGLPAA